jgi:hypothetical protein
MSIPASLAIPTSVSGWQCDAESSQLKHYRMDASERWGLSGETTHQ